MKICVSSGSDAVLVSEHRYLYEPVNTHTDYQSLNYSSAVKTLIHI
jgi:hypothetical protein